MQEESRQSNCNEEKDQKYKNDANKHTGYTTMCDCGVLTSTQKRTITCLIKSNKYRIVIFSKNLMGIRE